MNRLLQAWRWELALALLVLGVRLAVFGYAGSPLPYYDQWVAEYNNIFLRLLHGDSFFAMLLSRHNEHLLLTTRLASLGGFLLNGYWDVTFLIAVAAGVRALEAALLYRLLTTNAPALARRVTWWACVAVFVAPVSGFNLLCGLQVSFYFAELALIGALFVVQRWGAPARSATALVAVTIAGLLSMGSALALPVASAVAHVADGRRRRGFWPAWWVTVALAVAYVAIMATGRNAGTPLLEKLRMLGTLLAWPLAPAAWSLGVVGFLGVALVGLRRSAALRAAPVPAVLGVTAFALTNVAMIAANRPVSDFHLRHWEMVALVPFSLVVLGAHAIAGLRDLAAAAALAARWVAGTAALIYLGVFALQLRAHSWAYLAAARDHRAEAAAYYHHLFTSGAFVAEAEALNARVLQRGDDFFDDPILRFTPHPVVLRNIAARPLPALALLGPDILPSRPTAAVAGFVHALIRWSPCLAIAGALLGMAAWLEERRSGRLGAAEYRLASAKPDSAASDA